MLTSSLLIHFRVPDLKTILKGFEPMLDDSIATKARNCYSLLPYSVFELRRGLTDAADAGYDGVELTENHLEGLDAIGGPKDLARFAENLGLPIVAAGLGIINGPIAKFDRMLETAAHLGVKSIIWVPPIRTFESWQNMIEMAIALEEMANGYGLALWSHAPHGATLVETPEELQQLLSDLPNVRLCFDTGHYGLFDADLTKAAETFGDAIEHLHIRNLSKIGAEILGDYLPVRKKWEIIMTLNTGFTGPQEGVLNLESFVNTLVQGNFNGWWSIENSRGLDSDRFKGMQAAISALKQLKGVKSR